MYCAPEMCDLYTGQFVGPKVDIWALGLILYTLIYWKHPFQDEGKLGIVNAKLSYPKTNYPPALEEIMRFCLVVDPEKRPNAEELVDLIKHHLKALKSGKSGNKGGHGATSQATRRAAQQKARRQEEEEVA